MRSPVVAAALVLLLSGCGSTIESGAGQSTAAGNSGLSLPTTSAPPPASSTGEARTPNGLRHQPSPSGPATVASTRAAHGRTGQSSQSPSSTTSQSPTGTPSASHNPVRVGLLYSKDITGAAAAIGLGALSTGNTLAQTQALVHWVNDHGGLGGHPIQLLSYSVSSSSGNSVDAAYEAACTALTQDDHVRYMLTIASLPPDTLPCFAQAGVGVLDDETGLSEAQMAPYSGYIAGPGDFALDRATTNLVDDLWRRGWLTSTSKVGSLATDLPQDTSVVNGALTQALAAHGLKIAVEASVPESTATITDAPGIALKFRAAGVNRVIPVAASPLFLMIAAATQGYHPAYAVTSLYGPGALIESTAPKAELVNSVGIGWQPLLDIGKGKQPHAVSSNETLCFKLMAAAGQSSSSATTRGFEAQICDLVFYLKAMGDALPTIPADLIAAARPVIGTGFRPADTFRSDMRQHPDGVAAYRDLAYEQGCSCYQYVGAIRKTTS